MRITFSLKIKKSFQDRDCILWALDFMSRCTLILVNLIIISPPVCLVAEEVDGCVLYSGQILLRFQVLQAVCFVPSGGEDVKGYLSTNRVATDDTNGLICRLKKGGRLGSSLREAKVWELFLERSDKVGPNLVLSVVFLIVIPFLYAGVAAYRGDVHHSVPDYVELARTRPWNKKICSEDIHT